MAPYVRTKSSIYTYSSFLIEVFLSWGTKDWTLSLTLLEVLYPQSFGGHPFACSSLSKSKTATEQVTWPEQLQSMKSYVKVRNGEDSVNRSIHTKQKGNSNSPNLELLYLWRLICDGFGLSLNNGDFLGGDFCPLWGIRNCYHLCFYHWWLRWKRKGKVNSSGHKVEEFKGTFKNNC